MMERDLWDNIKACMLPLESEKEKKKRLVRKQFLMK